MTVGYFWLFAGRGAEGSAGGYSSLLEVCHSFSPCYQFAHLSGKGFYTSFLWFNHKKCFAVLPLGSLFLLAALCNAEMRSSSV